MDDDYEHINKSIIYVNSHYLLTKTFFMKKLFTIMLFAAMLLPWAAQSQAIMPSYTFNTGVDATKWITLDATATQLFGAAQDDYASPVVDFGFNFQFGEDYYHQFSVSTNGLFTLGPVAAGTSNSYAKFNSSNNFPKIIGVGKDLGTCTGGYIKYQIVGQAPSRTLVVEYKTGHHYTSTNIADVNWQVQLHENSNKVIIVYSSTAPSTNPDAYQIGLGISQSDFLIIDPSTHTTTHHTASYSTTNSNTVWPGASRYYEFVAPVITCIAPVNLAAVGVTDAEATITWENIGLATQWIVEYGSAGFTRGTGTTTVVNDTSYQLNGLTTLTSYDVYVRAVCGANDSSSVRKLTFRTNCVPLADSTLPLFESFDTWTTTTMDQCWLRGTSDGSTTYPSFSTSYGHTGSKSVYMYSSASYASWMVLPEFDRPITDLQVSFWMRSSSLSYPLIVAVVPEANNMNDFDTIAVVKCSAASVWEFFEFPLSVYQGRNGRIALISPNGVSSMPYIDDVTVELMPPCPRPINLSANATGSSTATVRWTSTGASDYQVEYDTLGFTQGTGIVENVVGDSVELMNLLPGKYYQAYVRAYCGTDSSDWVGPVRFNTDCEGITANNIPMVESFEDYVASSALTSIIDPCWVRYTNVTTSSLYPYVSSTYAATGTKSMYMYSTNAGFSAMVLPEFQEDFANYQLSFKMYRNSTTYESPIMVGIMTNRDSISTFDTLAILKCHENSVWEYFEIPLSAYTGSGTYIAISTVPGVYCNAYIDDLTISEIGTCPAPVGVTATNITTNTADIMWTDNSNSSWIVEYGPAGFEPGTGTVDYTTTSTYSLYGLTASSGYDVYVRADCSDTTGHAVLVSFRTECGEYLEIPFVDNFDSYGFGTNVKPQCWLYGGYNASYPQISASQKASGVASAYLYVYQPSTPVAGTHYWTYMLAPQVDVTSTPINTLQVSFKQKATSLNATNYPGTVVVGVVSDTANIDSTFYPLDTIRSTEAGIWEEFDVSLANYPVDSTGSYIAIASIPIGTASSFYNYVYIDDLKIDYIPTCTRPQEILVTNTGMDAATIQWFDNNATNSTWDIAYGPNGFDPDSTIETGIGTILPNIVGVSGDSLSVQNLSSGTMYDFYIRTNCGSEYSAWRGPVVAIPGSINVPASGMTTITGCSVVVCDPGGIDDTYGNSANGYVVVYPGSTDSLVAIVGGTIYTESNYDYVKVYDGVGISSEPVYSVSGSAVISDTIRSTTGPLTIQFTSDGSVVYDGFTLMMSCVEAPRCSPVGNIAVTNIGYRSAFLTWERLIETEDTPSFYLEIVDANGNVDPITTTDMFYFLSGLDVSSSYTVRIKNICADNESAFDSISFTTLCWANIESDTITDATTSTSYYIPVNNFYRNSYSQQLVLASEMNGATTISGIQFEYAYATAMTDKNNVSIYMHHSSTTALTTSAWDPTSDAQLVYTGNLNCSQGWNEFTFNSPFIYDGTSNIVITIVDQSDAYDGSSYTFRTHSATGKALYYQTDSPMTVPPTSRTAYSYRANMKFMACDNTIPITCPGPNVVVTNVEPTQVDIIWASNGSETSWDVEYRLVGESAWTMAAAAYTNTSYSLTNLLSASNYQIRVSALCGTENGTTIVDVTTPCTNVSTYPFAENFDTWNTGSSSEYGNMCWGRLTNYSSTRYPYVSASYSMSSNNSVYIYGSSSYYSALVLPKFDLPTDTLMISFGAYITSAAYQVQVGVMTDPEDIYSFTPIGVAHPSATSQWQMFEFNLSSYTGEDGYIAIVAPQGTTSYVYVDNVEVYPIPSCPRPTNVTVDPTTITTNSAMISWTDTIASSWMVEYGPRGFVRGTGTMEYATSQSHTLQGLDHSTYYDVYVYALCSATDTSYASFPVSFATLCSTMEFPLYEDYTGYQTGSSTSVPHFPLCWSGGGYSTTYPYINSTAGIDGVTTICQYMYAYAAAADRGTQYTYLALPAIDSTMYQMSDIMLSFVTKAGTISSTYDARLYVGVATDPNNPATFVAIDTIERTTTDWVVISELELSSYTGNGKYIVFWVCPQTASYSSFYIDEIEVDVIPTCWRPQDLHITDATATSIELAWTERNNATSWTIEYVPAGQVQGTGTTVVATTNPFTITGLTATTHYDFYVKSNCSATDESRYTRKLSGWTTQVPATVPYAYDFENATEWGNWATTSNTTSNWARGTATAAQGSNAIYVSTDGGATNSTIDGIVNATTYRDFDFGANDTNFTVTFKAKAGGRTDGNYDGLMLFLVDPWLNAESSATALNTPWGHVNNIPRVNGLFVRLDTVYDEYAVELDAVSGIKRLAFYYFNQSHAGTFVGGPAAVDDINMVYTSCPRPTNVTATNLTTNSADISWNGSASGYYVYYRREEQQTIDSIYTTSNSITLTNLASNGTYLLAVKSVCGSEMSIFSSTIQFYTPQVLAQVPYYCGFEANENETSQWAIVNDNATNGWCVGTATADSGSASLYVTNDFTTKPNAYTETSASVAWAFRDFYLPAITATDTFEINFRWRCAGEGTFDHMRVYIGPIADAPAAGNLSSVTDPVGATLLATELQDRYDDEGAASGYITERIILSGADYAAGNYRIYLCWKNDGSVGVQPPASVDEFQILAPMTGCMPPSVTVVPGSTTAELTFNEAGNYDVAYKAIDETAWSAEAQVLNASTYTITGLAPLTTYEYRVRKHCDDSTISNWTMGTFATEDLPCLPPTNVTATNIAYSSATITWTPQTNGQEGWKVAYGYGNDENAWDTIFVTSASVDLTGLYASTEYTVRVRTYCSVESDICSEWSDAYTFTTSTCESVSGLTADNITSSSAVISWTAPAGQTKWELTYGMQGVDEEHGTKVTVTVNPTFTIEGLDYDTPYDVYVRAVCGDGIYSAWSQKLSFTTRPVGINTAAADNTNVNIYPNPANTQATITVEGVNGKVEFAVADMNGRMIVTETIDCDGELVKTIDVSNLAKGAYFVHIYNDNFNATRKLIVK